MSKLTIYDPVYGAFFLKSEQYDTVRNQVKLQIGEGIFKQGFSAGAASGATKILKATFQNAGILPVVPTGSFQGVDYVQTSDGLNQYHKLRVMIKGDEDYLLSLDLGTDTAKRLISKLGNCTPGQVIKVLAWPILEQKGDRSFINHSVSVKGADDVEVPAVGGLFAKAKDQAEVKINIVGSTDKKVIDSIKKAEQTKVFLGMLDICKTKFEMAA